MYPLKQSTALTIPVFVHDSSGDAVTGLVDGGFTKRISKNGAAWGAMTVTITEQENGWYSVPISTSHSDTLGVLSITFTHGSAKQVNLQFRVESKLVADLNDITAANVVNEWETQSQADPTGFHVNVMESGGTAQTANDNGLDITTLITRVTAAVATEAKQDIAQTDLDTITGTDGVTLATLQALYAPAKIGALMGLADSAITAAKFDADAIAAAGFAASAAQKIRDEILPTQNVALNNLEFLWVAASDHVTPVTGATGTDVTRSIDGAAWANAEGALAEVGNGIYQFDASQADMNGGIITFRFVATGGTPGAPDDAFMTIVTGGGV